MDTFQKHQFAIAKRSLKLTDAGALILGGMTKYEARQFLANIGWSKERIAGLEYDGRSEARY